MGYLTADRVNEVFNACISIQSELEGSTIVEGILSRFGFRPERIQMHKETIKSFFLEVGVGGPFSSLCVDTTGKMWTDSHMVIERLVCLGLAAGYAEYTSAKSEWHKSGGLPSIKITGVQELKEVRKSRPLRKPALLRTKGSIAVEPAKKMVAQDKSKGGKNAKK